MTDGKRVTKQTLLEDIAQISAELEEHPQRRMLFKSDLLQAKAAVSRIEAQLMELRAREYSLKTAQASCEKMLDAINKKTIQAIDQEEQRKGARHKERSKLEKTRGSPHPWSPLDDPELPPVQPPPALSAEPPKDAPKPTKRHLVNVGDESKDWTPLQWKFYYDTGMKPHELKAIADRIIVSPRDPEEPAAPAAPAPEPAPTDLAAPADPHPVPETERTPLDAEVTR